MKGVYYTVEAVIAVVMVVSVVYILLSQSPVKEYSLANQKLKIFNSLKLLDEEGYLRLYALKNDSESIKSALEVMSPYTNFYVVIFDENLQNVTKSFSEPLFEKNVISVSYYISGDFRNYGPREVRVYAWGFE